MLGQQQNERPREPNKQPKSTFKKLNSQVTTIRFLNLRVLKPACKATKFKFLFLKLAKLVNLGLYQGHNAQKTRRRQLGVNFQTRLVKFMIHFYWPLLKTMLTFALQYKNQKQQMIFKKLDLVNFDQILAISKFLTPPPIDKKQREPKNNQTDRHLMASYSKFISQIYWLYFNVCNIFSEIYSLVPAFFKAKSAIKILYLNPKPPKRTINLKYNLKFAIFILNFTRILF